MYTLLLTQGIYSVTKDAASVIREAIESKATAIDVDIAMLAGTPPRRVLLAVAHVVALLEPHRESPQPKTIRPALRGLAPISWRAGA